jgi:acetolactate synthase small subunit
MKREKNRQDSASLAIYSEDTRGLLGQVTGVFNRRNWDITGLQVFRTDVTEIVLICMEAEVPAENLSNLLKKLEQLIGVFKAIAITGDAATEQVAHYRVKAERPDEQLCRLLQQYGGVICSAQDGSLVIRKTGTDRDIRALYERLDGELLISFCSGNLPPASALLALDSLFCRDGQEG